MKEKFLNDLEKALKDASIENIEDILNVYSSRFDLGYEAGMTDEEILEMLESIEEIVKQHTNKSKEGFNVALDLFYFSDFKIVETSGDEIEFLLDDKAYEFVSIESSIKSISLKSKHKPIFNKRLKVKGFEGVMKIGKNILINQFNIKNVACDVSSAPIIAKEIILTNVSGDFTFDKLAAEEQLIISNTSGDFRIKDLSAPSTKINTISGDFTIDSLMGKQVYISVVSGDVEVSASNDATYKINSVSGDIVLNGNVDADKVSFSNVSGSCIVDGVKVGKDISSTLKEAFSKIHFKKE